MGSSAWPSWTCLVSIWSVHPSHPPPSSVHSAAPAWAIPTLFRRFCSSGDRGQRWNMGEWDGLYGHSCSSVRPVQTCMHIPALTVHARCPCSRLTCSIRVLRDMINDGSVSAFTSAGLESVSTRTEFASGFSSSCQQSILCGARAILLSIVANAS